MRSVKKILKKDTRDDTTIFTDFVNTLKKIKKHNENQSIKAETYADVAKAAAVAARSAPLFRNTRRYTANNLAAERKVKEILVRISDIGERQGARMALDRDLLERTV